MSHFIPQPAYYDFMPVDISFVFEKEKPAGKHGFVRADGDDLRFEDGTVARFWGVNVNGGACFPEHNYSEKFARRLAQSGCNMVRFHQMDAQFDTPNIFAYTKGKRVSNTRKLDERSLDALDYLIYCLKNEGIYVYLDLLTYRHFKSGDGVMQFENLRDSAKPWCNVNPRLIELQKEFATQLWTHYNPYTKLAYKDEPAIALTEIVNECDLFGGGGGYGEQVYEYEKEFREFFRDWLCENNIKYDWENCEIKGNNDTAIVNFKIYITQKFYREMYDCLRSVGVKIPITGTNWSNLNALTYANSIMDFTDGHNYFYDWRWNHKVRACANSSITSYFEVFPNLAMNKIAEKPYFVSEWDMPWPNAYRAEGPIYYACVGALQGWSGFTIHTYSYGTQLNEMKILGREQSTPVGGIPYREGIFSTWNDPAKFGLFYHCALITRRQDIKPTNDKVAINVKELEKSEYTAFKTVLEQKTAGCVFDGKAPEGYSELFDDISKEYPQENEDYFETPDGQMKRDLVNKIGCVDTDRTKIAYGFLSNVKEINFGNGEMKISAQSDFGVIALSSLTDEAICNSDNILLSAIGRAENTDMKFVSDILVDIGKPPIIAEVLEADISIKTEKGKALKVWGVNAEGFYSGEVPTEYKDGVLSFHIGNVENSACYYLIVED